MLLHAPGIQEGHVHMHCHAQTQESPVKALVSPPPDFEALHILERRARAEM
jgi:hypothetical protein